jgi:hypothetical protein
LASAIADQQKVLVGADLCHGAVEQGLVVATGKTVFTAQGDDKMPVFAPWACGRRRKSQCLANGLATVRAWARMPSSRFPLRADGRQRSRAWRR